MRLEYINPFVESAIHILKSTVSEDIARGELRLSTTNNELKEIAIIVGLAGQVSGTVVIDMDKKTALEIASSMNEEKLNEFDELVSATLAELGNMIVGMAVTKLYELGFQFDLTPPALFMGENLKISNNKLETLIVPVKLSEGELGINVAIKEN